MDQQPCLDTQHVTDGSLSLCLTGIVFNSLQVHSRGFRGPVAVWEAGVPGLASRVREGPPGTGATAPPRSGPDQGAGQDRTCNMLSVRLLPTAIDYVTKSGASTQYASTASPWCFSRQRVGSSVFADAVSLANTGAAALAAQSAMLAAEVRHAGHLAGYSGAEAVSVSDLMCT